MWYDLFYGSINTTAGSILFYFSITVVKDALYIDLIAHAILLCIDCVSKSYYSNSILKVPQLIPSPPEKNASAALNSCYVWNVTYVNFNLMSGADILNVWYLCSFRIISVY